MAGKRFSLAVGIAGPTCAGKTTLAYRIIQLLARVQVGYLPQDAYYKDQGHLPPYARERINYDHPAVLDLDLLAVHVEHLKGDPNSQVDMPVYDYATHTRGLATRIVKSAQLILVEGTLILTNEALRCLLDYKIYIDYPEDIRLRRRMERDVAERGRTEKSVREQYYSTVKPMYEEFVVPSQQYADKIVFGDEDGMEVEASFVGSLLRPRNGEARRGEGGPVLKMGVDRGVLVAV
jgi:uridine kinase